MYKEAPAAGQGMDPAQAWPLHVCEALHVQP